jgi:hypothetical protein
VVEDRGVGVRFLVEARDFSLYHSVQTGSRALPAFYQMVILGYSTRSRAAWGRDVKLTTHLHLVPRLRMVEVYLHSPIRHKPRDDFTLPLTLHIILLGCYTLFKKVIFMQVFVSDYELVNWFFLPASLFESHKHFDYFEFTLE